MGDFIFCYLSQYILRVKGVIDKGKYQDCLGIMGFMVIYFIKYDILRMNVQNSIWFYLVKLRGVI